MNLDELQTAVESQLEKIEEILGPNYRLTLIANHNRSGGLMDADLILTMSDRQSILRAVDRFLPDAKEEKPDLSEEVAALRQSLAWAINTFQGESGMGDNYWEQFPEYITACALLSDTHAKPKEDA